MTVYFDKTHRIKKIDGCGYRSGSAVSSVGADTS